MAAKKETKKEEKPIEIVGGKKYAHGSLNHVDWEALQHDYRSGILTIPQLSTLHMLCEQTIREKARQEGWERNLTGKIQAAKEYRLNIKSTIEEMDNLNPTENEIVQTVAELQSKVILAHRRDIGLARKVCMKLIGELDALTDHADDVRLLGEMMRSPDDNGNDKKNDVYEKIISMKGRTEDMKRLSDSIHKLIELEAKAFGISDYRDDRPATGNGIDPAKQQRDEDYNAIREKMNILAMNNSSGKH